MENAWARRAAALAAGVVVGLLARHLPAQAALRVVGHLRDHGCGMEEVLECSFRELPDTIATVLRFLALLAAIGLVMLAGAVFAGVKAGRRIDRNGLGLLGLAGALATPPIWLLLDLIF